MQLEKEEGAYWILIGPFRTCLIPVICQAVHGIKKGFIRSKNPSPNAGPSKERLAEIH